MPRAALTAARLALLLVAVAALSALDVCFLEETVKPIAREHGIPWSRFTTEALGIRTMTWHFYFAPAGLLLLGFAGVAVRRDWRGALAGPLLMLCGHEDLLYYVLLREAPPPALPWLDLNPAIAWTRLLEGAPHVTRAGLLVACALSLAAAAALLRPPAAADGSTP